MPRFHLQLFASRFNEVAENYLQRVGWIYEGTVPEIRLLEQAIDSVCSKEQLTSQRSLVFDDVEFGRDILRFFDPVQCCGKTLLDSDTLIMHIMMNHDGGRDGRDSETKRRAILFNLYVQIATGILQRYDNNYDQIEHFTVQRLRKASEYLSCILRKPIRADASAADTFTENVTFAKWKYVFDYTCGTCADTGIHNCRYLGAIAWFQIHLNTMGVNPIRHLGTKMHAANLRDCVPDRVVPPKLPAPSRPEVIIRSQELSRAARYILEVRESELDKLCAIGTAIKRNTPYDAVDVYLKTKLEPLLQKITIKPFGSRVIGVADQDSDLDLVIIVNSGMKPKTAYYKVLSWANENKKEVEVRRKIPEGPRVLSLYVHSLKMTLDLTFDSPYVAANSAIIDYYFRLQPMARKFFFLLKEWKKRTDISQNFHHNVLTSMMMFYLQQRQCLLPVRYLINGPEKADNLYNTDFTERATYYLLPNSFHDLVQGFFSYWATFDYARSGASSKDGKVRPKTTFPNGSRQMLPPIMLTDYFDTTRNVAGNVHSNDLQKFVQACQEAVSVLNKKRNF